MSARDFCILYVDDDENDIRLVKFASDPAGVSHCLQTVNSGSQAIDYFQGRGHYADRSKFPLPNVLLLDLRMPRMNGLDVLRWLRTQPDLTGTVVIVFTASAHPDDVMRACELGANAFVQKPSGQAQLTRFLQLLKAFWADFHQYPQPKASPLLTEVSKPDLSP